MEAHIHRYGGYRECCLGGSVCRLCNKCNGSTDYQLLSGEVRWIWPEGYRHYLEEHQCLPTPAFERLILAMPAPTPAAPASSNSA